MCVCVCSLRYGACNGHAPYCHLSPFRLYCFHCTLSHELQDFPEKKVIQHKMCFDFLYNFVWSVSNCRKNLARSCHKCAGLRVKYRLFLSDFNQTWIFLYRFPKNKQTSNYQKICPPRADLFHAADRGTDGRTGGQLDRRTNVTKLIVAFSNFAKTPQNANKVTCLWGSNLYAKSLFSSRACCILQQLNLTI